MSEATSISVTVEVRERVKQFAAFKDETYSDILTRIMDTAMKVHAFHDIVDMVNTPETKRLYLHKAETGADIDMFFVKKASLDADDQTPTIYICEGGEVI